jgi:hypothetical protein
MADEFPTVQDDPRLPSLLEGPPEAGTELTPVSLKSMDRSQLMNLAERIGYDGSAAGQKTFGSLMTKLVRQIGFVGKNPSEIRFELGFTESIEDDMESAYGRGINKFRSRGTRPEGPPTSVPTENLEAAALDLYREWHRSGFSEPWEGVHAQELSNIVEELSERHARTPFDVARDLKARAGADEPPPKDQPRLPLLLAPPGEPGKKPSKGSIFRGIGSLMRRRIFPLIQAAQAGWGALSPEARAEVEAFLERPAHELVGMDKPGIEYFKEWLGISPEDLGETPSEAIPLSDLQKYVATYHGGPSKWAPEPGYPEGRPRLEMVGTGEGAAAYGHGFYSAEAKGVARTYQDDLTRNRWRDIQDRIDIDPETELYRATRQDGTTKNFANEMDAQQFIADDLGALYKIDVPESEAAKLLDWDAPLSEQSAGVREAFQKAFEGAGIPDAANMNPNGKSAYTWLAAALGRGVKDADTILKLGSDPKRASEALRKAGIPGLKYLDEFSRDNKNLYKGKSLVKKNGKALFLNEDWQRQGRNVLQYLVDNNMDVDEFISQRREFHGRKGRISRALGGARQQEKFLDILEGTVVKKSPLTRNYVIWDQGLLDQLRTVRKEAAGGFIDKPLYEEARVGGLI